MFSWEDFPDRKFNSNSSTRLRMQLSYFAYLVAWSSHSQVLQTCDKIQRREAENSLFCYSLSMCFVKRSLSENSCVDCRQLAGEFQLPLLLGWNIQEVSSSISTSFKVKCFLFFFCCCFLLLSLLLEAGYRCSSFLNLTTAKSSSYQVHLHSSFLLNCYFARNVQKLHRNLH